MRLFKRLRWYPFPVYSCDPLRFEFARVAERPIDAVMTRTYTCFRCKTPVFFWKDGWCNSEYTFQLPNHAPLNHGCS